LRWNFQAQRVEHALAPEASRLFARKKDEEKISRKGAKFKTENLAFLALFRGYSLPFNYGGQTDSAPRCGFGAFHFSPITRPFAQFFCFPVANRYTSFVSCGSTICGEGRG
jgi:hypothetical protein